MSVVRKTIVACLLGGGALAFSATGASAEVVCSGNTCWHVKEKVQYPSEAHVTVHEDTWKAGPDIKFREHAGRGYWKGDAWVDIH
jgi:hypothetical protein